MTETCLDQSSFSNGTYRIQKSGCYRLASDILFNPPLTGTTLPASGYWFAAISIECGGVTLDLNGHTLEISANYVKNNLGGAFAAVLLANSPYPKDPIGQGLGAPNGLKYYSFAGDTAFTPASDVKVLNGTINGHGSWWGIKGNNNVNVTLKDLLITNFQFTGISLENVTNECMKRVLVKGPCDPIYNNAVQIQINLLRIALNSITNWTILSYTKAQVLQGLTDWIAANPTDYNEVYTLPRTTLAGIWISSGSAEGTDWYNYAFPTTSAFCAKKAAASNGGNPTKLNLVDVKVDSLTMDARVVPTVAASNVAPLIAKVGTGGTLSIPLYYLGIFGSWRWKDVTLPNGNFSFDAISIAIAALGTLNWALVNATVQAMYPTGYIVAGDNLTALFGQVLTSPQPNPVVFNAVAEYGRGPYYLSNEGLHGVRIECSSCVLEENVCVKSLKSVGPPGVSSNLGNLVNGFTLSVDTNVSGCNLSTGCLIAENGTVTAFYVTGDDDGANLTNLVGKHLISNNSSESVVGLNLSSTNGYNSVNGLTLVDMRGSTISPFTKINAPNSTITGVSLS